jgi:hypothetical protein
MHCLIIWKWPGSREHPERQAYPLGRPWPAGRVRRERFLQQVGRSHAYASVFADDLASNSESFAELLALESPRVVWMADQVRAGIEHARGIAQARAARRQQVQA